MSFDKKREKYPCREQLKRVWNIHNHSVFITISLSQFGNGKEAVVRNARATSPQLEGKITIKISTNNKAKVSAFKVKRPAIVKVIIKNTFHPYSIDKYWHFMSIKWFCNWAGRGDTVFVTLSSSLFRSTALCPGATRTTPTITSWRTPLASSPPTPRRSSSSPVAPSSRMPSLRAKNKLSSRLYPWTKVWMIPMQSSMLQFRR